MEIILISINFFSFGQEKYLHFTEIDGLPRNITTCLEQDKYGYLWIGTGNGIVRYDGENFFMYPELSGMGINDLLYDSHGTLWVTNEKGLFRFNRLTNYFEQIVHGYISRISEDNGKIYFLMISNIYVVNEDSTSIIYTENNISDFCFSQEGMWIGIINNGVRLLSRQSGFKKIAASFLNKIDVSLISKINDLLFVGCYNGQLFVIQDNGEPKQIDIKNHYFFKKIIKIGKEIWLATDGNGILILDKDLRLSRTLGRSPNTNASISSNSIYDIFLGRNHEIWLATYGAGLTCILPDNLLFRNILPEKGNENSLVANEGVSVFIKKHIIYFGTNYGLSVYNENTHKFRNFFSERLRKDLNGTKVTAILYDQKNTLWVGTYDGLLGMYSSDFKLLKTFHPSSTNPHDMQRIVLLHEIPENHLLIVTQFQNNILLNFDRATGNSQVFELYSKGSNNTYCLLNSIRKNQQGELLALISDKGLFHVNWKDNILENKLQDMNKQIHCYISDFYHDKKKNYWFATSANGLLCVSEDGKKYKKWTIKEGLPSNTLIRIESTDDRFLWISTISGICRFDTHTGQIQNFNLSDGLPANEFLERVSARTDDGRLIFGSIAGFTIVDPQKVTPDTSKTEVIISDITFQNKSIRNPKGKQFLKQPLEDTRELWLPYSMNSFSIHFFIKGKNFIKYHNYAYRLSGLEKNMNYLGETNHATYTNLSPGTYTFEIKSAEKKQESAITRLIIHIKTPWYLSWYAYMSYTVIMFIIIYLSVYAYKEKVELKKEKEISEFKIQQEHKLTEKKLEFFTNISHDLKTPLTLIEAPVSDLLQSGNLDQDQVKKLTIIQRNSKRLYNLITDILDFRKLTQKHDKLLVKETDINTLVDRIYYTFLEECKNKSILFERSVKDGLKGFIDEAKVERIVWNLLSNAIKFTPSGGIIGLSVNEIITEEGRKIELKVKDNGIGISAENQGKIFNRFFKIQNGNMLNNRGTGIGLFIVKELVSLHHGNIGVDSKPGIGTTFTITIPADQSFFKDYEFADIEEKNMTTCSFAPQSIREKDSKNLKKQKQYNLPVILLVEDNSELRDYLAGHFEKDYKVYQAEDGFSGLLLAKEVNPDIILTDILMPNMDGYKFCKEIRQNFDTSHIPVVILTANSAIDHQIEGLSTGADIYLTKPFEIKLLDTVLSSILENRKMLRNKFLGIDSKESPEKSLPQKDIDFMNKLKLFIEENIMNINIELLAVHFAISTTQLNRKIKALTGSTPNNLIKSIRLRKAFKLIHEEGYRVSEAAYQTGFTDPNYFTTCFRKEFGKNPSKII
jgi:signal transduction histidine kinase/DNA-binding response OmpR family regulator/ligand-binding sensor domain-containing protein